MGGQTMDRPNRESRGTILYVEDNPDYRLVLAEELRDRGFEIIEAATTRQAVNQFERHVEHIDIIVQDLYMETLDQGFELMKYYRKKTDIPILVVSSWNEFPYIRDAMKSGATAFLPKEPSYNPRPTAITSDLDRELREEQFKAHSGVFVAEKADMEHIADIVLTMVDSHRSGGAEMPYARQRDRAPPAGDLFMDQESSLCTWKGKTVHLTRSQFALVHELARFPDHVKTRKHLAEILGSECETEDDRNIVDHVKRLRSVFKKVDCTFDQIFTVRGQGYRWKK